MNLTHRYNIARNLVTSLCKLLDGEVKYQTVYVPQGAGKPTKVRQPIIIEHDNEED